MNTHFRPTRADGRSLRDVAVDAFKDEPPESLVSYKTLGKALGLNADIDLQKIQAAARAANRVLLRLHSRGVRNVPRSGYRILPAREHIVAAQGHRSKADKAMGWVVAFFDGARLEEMTPAERKTHEGLSIIAHGLEAMHSYNKVRFDRLEALFKGPLVDPNK
jgi:hypothetical protein